MSLPNRPSMAPSAHNTHNTHNTHNQTQSLSHNHNHTHSLTQNHTQNHTSHNSHSSSHTHTLSQSQQNRGRQYSHLHAQLAQLAAQLADTENLVRMTAVQAEYVRGLGGWMGGLFMASSRVLGEETVAERARGGTGVGKVGGVGGDGKKEEEEAEEEDDDE